MFFIWYKIDSDVSNPLIQQFKIRIFKSSPTIETKQQDVLNFDADKPM